MYSGTTLRNQSGGMLGTHQKIDRVARRHLTPSLPADITFPTIRQILKFEGKNGPDGIKRKSPSRDEPWHYIDPDNPDDTRLLDMIDNHIANLIQALADDDDIRAAFEAAWLAHTIVDGLTPAHHYPLEKKIEELWGHPKEQRLTFRQKNVILGKNKRDTVSKNWQYWGAKGVFTTHIMFEFGVSSTIATRGLHAARPSANERIRVEREGVRTLFLETMHHIHHLKMYETFYKRGWTRALARQTHDELIPSITRVVTLAWYYTAVKAAERKERRT